MSRRQGLGSGLVLLLWLLVCCTSCSSGDGVVEGIVFESQREIAIEDAFVTIRSLEGDKEEQFTLTDINGLYRFENVREGLNEVTVIKEGYRLGNAISVKLADVVEGETLVLDFQLSLLPLIVRQSMTVRVMDENGPLEGAVIDYYTGPCEGKSSLCQDNLPEEDDLFDRFEFRTSLSSDENGEATLSFSSLPAVEEFNEYRLQFRITTVDHQNAVFDIYLTVDDFPSSVELFLPRL